MGGSYMVYIVITVIFSLIGGAISNRLRSKFAKYSRIPLNNGMSGREVAQSMLDHYGIRDVKVVQGQGFLTDHYNPLSKTVSLSPEVYNGRHISAAAVASHECGHAVQHAKAYPWLKLRSAIVPVVNIAARAQQFLLMFAIGSIAVGGSGTLLLITIAAFGVTTAFSLITLPVEFDASNRALAWLENTNVTRGAEQSGAKDALWWAAMTYVVAALSSLVILVWLVLRYMGARD